MIEFIETHKQDIIYSITVIALIFALRILTNRLHLWLIKEKKRKFPNDPPRASNLLKRILNTLWLVLGIIALSYLFVENQNKGVIIENFKTALYIGIVLAITIIVATTVNLWLR